MKTKLLLKVKEHILENPNRLVMASFIIERRGQDTTFTGDGFIRVPFAECGTAACIAGWACVLTGHGADLMPRHRATEMLGITDKEAASLFFVSNWPVEFKDRYYYATTQHDRAQIVAERIDDFIKTNKPKRKRKVA